MGKNMRYMLATLALIFFISYTVFSDHHGRGHESTAGFPGIYGTDQFTLTFTGDGHLIFAIKKQEYVTPSKNNRKNDRKRE